MPKYPSLNSFKHVVCNFANDRTVPNIANQKFPQSKLSSWQAREHATRALAWLYPFIVKMATSRFQALTVKGRHAKRGKQREMKVC